MNKTKYLNTLLIAITVFATALMVSIPQASAESSLLIELNEQLNQESQQVQSGLVELKSKSSHQQSAHKWAEKVRTLPKESKDYAYARAEYARAIASDLEQKFATVSNIEQAASSMTETIERLADVHKRENSGRKSLFGQKDSEEAIQNKARQLAGLNNMFVTLINSDPAMQNPKLRQSYKAYELQWQNIKLQSSIPRGQGMNSLQRLRDSSESIAFLAKAYLNGLKHQTEITQIISIGGEASMVNREAQAVLDDGFDVLNPDGQAMQDMQMMLSTIDDTDSSATYQIGANPELSDEINNFANRLITERK